MRNPCKVQVPLSLVFEDLEQEQGEAPAFGWGAGVFTVMELYRYLPE